MAEHNGLDGKLMSIGEAVERFVADGSQICVGGFTINRNPMAAVYEIARRRIKDLHLVAHSNGQALDLLDGELEVDVLICDLSMPGLGGMATIREAQAKRTDLPAILLTGYFGDQSALPADGATFTLLRKPATLTELADSIAFLLAAGDRPDATSNPGEP